MSTTFKPTKGSARFMWASLLVAVLVGAGEMLVEGQNQNLTLRWAKAAPFPEPEEELYGIAVNGKMYVIGGFGTAGKPAPAMVYEYDPATDRWTKKKPIPVPVHHQTQAAYNGKIYVFGGCIRPLSGPGMNGWEPVDNCAGDRDHDDHGAPEPKARRACFATQM